MSAARGRSLALATIATITGGGLGLQAGEAGLGLAPGIGMWIALLGLAALLAVFVASREAIPASTTTNDEAGWAEFRRELRRSRRTVRPLTLLRLPGDELPEHGPDGAAELGTRARRLGLHLRLVDRTWVDEGSIYIMLPESPRSAADVLVERIGATSPGLLPERVRVATFPEDGLTSGAIIAALHDGAIDSVPIPIRPTVEGTEAAAFTAEEGRVAAEATQP